MIGKDHGLDIEETIKKGQNVYLKAELNIAVQN